jgi:hypothetical protein
MLSGCLALARVFISRDEIRSKHLETSAVGPPRWFVHPLLRCACGGR